MPATGSHVDTRRKLFPSPPRTVGLEQRLRGGALTQGEGCVSRGRGTFHEQRCGDDRTTVGVGVGKPLTAACGQIIHFLLLVCRYVPRSSPGTLDLCNKFHILALPNLICFLLLAIGGFPHSSVGKESACKAGDPGSIPVSGRSAGEGKGYPLQCSALENPMDGVVHGATKSWT